jgi:hypothetical protein
MATSIGWVIGAAYALTCLKLLAVGLDKLVQPELLGGLLGRVGATRRLARPALVRSAGAVEMLLFAALILVAGTPRPGAVVAGAGIAYIALVSPVGLLLLRRTGRCGCGGRSVRAGHGAADAVPQAGFTVRNAVMVLSLAGYPAWGSVVGVRVTVAAVAVVWLAQLASSLHHVRALGIELSGYVVEPPEELVQLSEFDVTGDDYFAQHLVPGRNGSGDIDRRTLREGSR